MRINYVRDLVIYTWMCYHCLRQPSTWNHVFNSKPFTLTITQLRLSPLDN